MNLDEAHEVILNKAAELANREVKTQFAFHKIEGDLFKPHTYTKGKLSLQYDLHESQYTEDEKNRLEQIAVNAVHQALLEEKKTFAGLIVGQAREGKNYFDWYDNAS